MPDPVESAEAPDPSPEVRLHAASLRPGEVAAVLGRYAIGRVLSLRELRRGSQDSLKLVVETDHGRFLLKRRAPGRDDAARVMLCHRVILTLSGRGFPAPTLVPDADGQTVLVLGGCVYELTEFVDGDGRSVGLGAAEEAGRLLAVLHRELETIDAPGVATGSYHDAAAHRARLAAEGLGEGVEPGVDGWQSSGRLLEALAERAAERVRVLGRERWASQLVHADWHAGNMVWRGGRILAVTDFDGLSRAPRIMDLAAGALHFSLLPAATEWGCPFDLDRFEAFCLGYGGEVAQALWPGETGAVPHLMIEALAAQAAGLDPRHPRAAPLRALAAEAGTWLEHHASRLSALVAGVGRSRRGTGGYRPSEG